jgi:hypothetical protein
MSLENDLCQMFVAEVLNSETASFFSSGTSAFSYLLDRIPIPREGTILVPSFTCEKLLLPLFARNQRFRLVDNHPDWVTPELDQYQAAYSEDTAAIVLIYVWGYAPRELTAIVNWARNKQILIIEDIASALGLSKGRQAFGSLGDYVFGSFGYDKPWEFGEGGFCAGTGFQPQGRGKGIRRISAKYNSLIKFGRNIPVFQLRSLLLRTIAARASGTLQPLAEVRDRIRGVIPTIDKTFGAAMRARFINTENYLGTVDQTRRSEAPAWTFFVPNNDQRIAVRLLGRFSDRDSVLRQLRQAGVWVGTDYACPLDHWALPGTASSATTLGRDVLSFITNERNRSIELCIQKLNALCGSHH